MVIPRHMVLAGYYGFALSVCPSVHLSYVRPSVISFSDDNLSECKWFFTTLYVHWYWRDLVWDCLWANFVSFWQSYLPATCLMFFSGRYHELISKDFTKLGVWIDIVEIWFWIANWQLFSIFELSAQDTSIISFPDDKLSKYQWIFTKLGLCIAIPEI